MLIFESGNISMSRGDVDDLLGQGWVMDNHLNAYSVVIGAKRRRTPQKIRSFLYVSPNHELKALQDDVPEAFPEGFVNWPVADAVGVPCQDNSWDCGVFIVKFMEVISSMETVSWADQKNWQEDMPRFRAEIVAEIFKTFLSSISESIARLDSSDA
ncbi:hypothetical protein KSP39_PZI010305 [Platanthera zijinensis]|uniref:Ubiquitin-like protease family profile domain-containing protein n=1 Tax=Platanthera zijinensis TaxID=2320716 RepID=A0AAP0G733_9ASPA